MILLIVAKTTEKNTIRFNTKAENTVLDSGFFFWVCGISDNYSIFFCF